MRVLYCIVLYIMLLAHKHTITNSIVKELYYVEYKVPSHKGVSTINYGNKESFIIDK